MGYIGDYKLTSYIAISWIGNLEVLPREQIN